MRAAAAIVSMMLVAASADVLKRKPLAALRAEWTALIDEGAAARRATS